MGLCSFYRGVQICIRPVTGMWEVVGHGQFFSSKDKAYEWIDNYLDKPGDKSFVGLLLGVLVVMAVVYVISGR